MQIVITRQHMLQIDVLRRRITTLVDKMSKDYGIGGIWQGNLLKISGTGMSAGVTGYIDVTPAMVTVVVDLPLLLGFLKGAIEKSISVPLDEALEERD